MRYVNGGFVNKLQAIAEASRELDALPQNTVVVITKTTTEKANPTYSVYATLGGLEAGQIRES